MDLYQNDLRILEQRHPELARRWSGARSLEDFFERFQGSLSGIDFVVMDEFSHDLILPLAEGFLIVGAG